MNTNILCLALICLTLLTAHFAHAGSPGMRCGRHLISKGWHLSQVKHHCGEPDSIETYHYDFHEPHGDTLVTELVYNFGPRKFMRLLRFENGRLVLIENLGYGYR